MRKLEIFRVCASDCVIYDVAILRFFISITASSFIGTCLRIYSPFVVLELSIRAGEYTLTHGISVPY